MVIFVNYTRLVMLLVLFGTLVTYSQDNSCHNDAYNRGGRCVRITACEVLRNVLQEVRRSNGQQRQTQVQRLRQSVVGCPRNSGLLVCCPNQKTNQRPDVSNKGLSVKCGRPLLTFRVVGGGDADLGAWPWMVQLGARVGRHVQYICGGTLISAKYVLTAAHCQDPKFRIIHIRLGEHRTDTNPDRKYMRVAPLVQDIAMQRFISHPNYRWPCRQCNDIALVELAHAPNFNGYVSPICLPTHPDQDMGYGVKDFESKVGVVTGWGSTSRDPNRRNNAAVLQQALIPLKRRSFCDALYPGYPDPKMTLCAGGNGRDTCNGDSGGPLMLSNQFATTWFLVGVTSVGPETCGIQNVQALYTSTHAYLPWILQNIK